MQTTESKSAISLALSATMKILSSSSRLSKKCGPLLIRRASYVGHLDIPRYEKYIQRIVVHECGLEGLASVDSQVDINLAPWFDSVFNRAKSEIKWIEAALVKVPTIARLSGLADMMIDGQTGLLAKDSEWKEKLENLILSADLRRELAENAYALY